MIPTILPTMPYEAVVNFTYRCNLSCQFCYQQKARTQGRQELSADQWLAFIDELSKMQVFMVTVSGGEPFSHPLCRPLLERIAAGKMRFKLLTNGTLIGPEEVQFLVKLKRCAQIQLSLDGFEPEHDAIRGKGAFRKTLNTLQLLADTGIPVVTNTVITRENYRNTVQFARFLETLPIVHYRLTPYCECCGGREISPAMLTPEELADLVAELDAQRDVMPHAYRRNLLFSLLADIRAEKDSLTELAVCPNTYRSFGVLPDGAVVPCPDALEPVLGYIGEKTFAEIWNGRLYQEFRAKAIAGITRNAEECVDCPYSLLCRKLCYLAHDDYYCRKKMAQMLRDRGVKC